VEVEDVLVARDLVSSNPSLGARDLLRLACCTRRGVKRIRTFDRALAAAFG
jgi:predicted nucleic acid-binding protein